MSSETPGSDSTYQPFNRVLSGLLFLTAIFLLNFISRVIFAPLLPVIEQDLGLSHTDSGAFFLIISAGYFFSILSSGFVSARLSHKKTIVFSTITSGVILCLLPLCTTFIHILLVLFFLGLGAGLYLPSGLAAITAVVSPAYMARGMAIHELAPNIGFVLAPFIAAFLTTWLSWSHGLLVFGVLLVVVGIAYGLWAKPGAGYGVKPDIAVCRSIISTREFWLMVLLFSLGICSTLGIYTMLPLYLVVDRNLGQVEANNLVALSRIGAVIMPLAGGWLGDRFGNRLVMTLVLFAGGLLTIPIGLLSGTSMLFFIILQPMLAVCFFPSGFTVLSRIGPAGGGNVAVSLCIPLSFLLGGGVIPLLIGVIGDYLTLGAGFIFAGVVISCGGFWALLLLGREKRVVISFLQDR